MRERRLIESIDFSDLLTETITSEDSNILFERIICFLVDFVRFHVFCEEAKS